MIYNQGYVFLIFTLDGIIIGILFDFFRILRKSFKTKDFVTNIEDILFWIIAGIIFLFSMCKFCNGELRFFMILGILLGVAIYILTISKIIIKISIFIIDILKRIIFRPIFLICIKIRNLILKILRIMKKMGGFFVKKEKYII